MLNREATSYLRDRRATFFFGDAGPTLPAGLSARWRLSPRDPHGWHANMVGFIDGPVARLPMLLDIAVRWFDHYHVDTWLDVDEFGIMFRQHELLEQRAFQLVDDWDAMVCRHSCDEVRNPSVAVDFAQSVNDIHLAAWIAEQTDRGVPIARDDPDVQRRKARFWHEYSEWGYHFAIATLDGRPAGTARLTNEALPLVVGVATLPEARGKGVATVLTSVLTRKALRWQGICALYVDRGSQAARIYGRLGYEPLFRSRAWVRRYAAGDMLW
jgi:GNAT superfamily N-acetyltransferase